MHSSLSFIRRYRLLLISFATGFVLMSYEMVAARILAPTIGSSTYVWTSVIGVVIAALSLGYWAGGMRADARHRLLDVVGLLLAVAIGICSTLILYEPVLAWVGTTSSDVRLQAVLVASLLFAPTSFALGMVAPYLVKLEIRSLQVAGRTVASLSALNSIGGIIGTFVTGFFLFGWIGSRQTLLLLVGLMLLMSWLLLPRQRWLIRLVITTVVLLLSLSVAMVNRPNHIDSASAHYSIENWQTPRGETFRGIMTGPAGIQSAVNVNKPDELVFWYTQRMAEAVTAAPQKDRILVLGGGTFTLPRYLAAAYPDSQIDVVEIDPALTAIAEQHFFYDHPANVTIINTDARRFVATSATQYDTVLVDVFHDGDVPFSLTTRQFSEQLAARLSPNATIIVNMIASDQPACLGLLQALDAPFRALRPDARYWFNRPGQLGNLVAVYGKPDNLPATFRPANFSSVQPYEDDFAPLERLTQQCRNSQ